MIYMTEGKTLRQDIISDLKQARKRIVDGGWWAGAGRSPELAPIEYPFDTTTYKSCSCLVIAVPSGSYAQDVLQRWLLGRSGAFVGDLFRINDDQPDYETGRLFVINTYDAIIQALEFSLDPLLSVVDPDLDRHVWVASLDLRWPQIETVGSI